MGWRNLNFKERAMQPCTTGVQSENPLDDQVHLHVTDLVGKESVAAIAADKNNAWLAQLVRRQSAVRDRGSGSIPGLTNTQGLKIIKEMVLLLL